MEEEKNTHVREDDAPGVQTRPAAAEAAGTPNAGDEHAPGARSGGAIRGRFPTATDYLVFLGIFFAANIVGYCTALLAGFPWPGTGADGAAEHYDTAKFNAVAYVVSMSLTLGGMLLYRARRGGPRRVAHFSRRGVDPVLLLWGVVFMLATSVVIEPLLGLLPDVPSTVYGRGVWAAVTLVVMAPLLEETIFRGVLLESTRSRYGVFAAWLISSSLFAVVHLHPTVAVNAFFMGLILGFVYLATDSLWTSIFLHAVNNGVAYVVLAMGLGDEGVLLRDFVANDTLYAVVYALAAAIFLLSGYMVLRTLRRLRAEEREQQPAEVQ